MTPPGTTGDLPFDASATPLARAAAWMLERYVAGELTARDVVNPEWVYPTDNVVERQRQFGVQRRPISAVLSYEDVDGVIAKIRVKDDRDRPMLVRVQQHPEHPGRVWTSSMVLDPPGVTVRLAGREDAAALRALELATPVQHDGFVVAYDRPDPFAQDRLRPLSVFRSVAEIDGVIVGTHTDACHILASDRGPVPVFYRHHSRVHPAHQGSGVMPAISGFQSEWIRRDGISRGVLLFTVIGNAAMDTFLSGGSGAQREGSWATPVVRYLLDCTALDRSEMLPPGRAADQHHVQDLLHRAHGRCVFWPGGDRNWLAPRMRQSPDDYSWNDLVISEHAAIGVWDAGWTVNRSSPTHTIGRRVATILDWGFDPNHPAELETAIRAACTRALESGITHLFAFSGPPGPGSDVLASVAAETEHFEIGLPTIEEPTDAFERGVYIDPVYF